MRFLQHVDPTYFHYLAETHGSAIEDKDEQLSQHAALALRSAYSQGLETLFAFIFATIQAPDCVAGWLLKYQVKDIIDLLEKVRDRKPIISLLKPERPTWHYITSAIFDFNEKERAEQLTDLYSELWKSLASDYLSEHFDTEYNNIKHGFRIQPGGFSFAIGVEDQPGTPAKQMFLLGESKYGSTFFVPEKIGNLKAHFRIKYTSLNWNLERFVVGLQLISMSLSNILACLRIANGVKPEEVEFSWPTNIELLNRFDEMHPSISHLTMDSVIHEIHVQPMNETDILKRYVKSTKKLSEKVKRELNAGA